MHDPINGHFAPTLTMAFACVAFVADDATDATKTVALLIGLVGAIATVVRLSWAWQDRRESRAARRRPPPDRPKWPRVSP